MAGSCPIETPEGPNIGLINSLATYARVNKYGFIEAPYRKVVDGKVTDTAIYMSAMDEGRYTVAQANAEINEDGSFAEDLVSCRQGGNYLLVRAEDIDYIDVSPKQLVSVAAALIPFLENDRRQPCADGFEHAAPGGAAAPGRPRRWSGTGMEVAVARDSGAAITAKRAGIVDQVDATRVVIRATEEMSHSAAGVDIYNLLKFQRSNQNTCINQRPLVRVGGPDREGRHHRRRSVDGTGRTGPWAQRAGRVHAVAGLQLRGLDPDLGTHRP